MPSRRAYLDPDAVQDLRDIWEFIAQDKPMAANGWIRRLRREIRMLARNPGIGHVKPEIVDSTRILFWPVREYQIVYREVEDGVHVYMVVPPGREIRSLIRLRARYWQ